MGISQNKFVEGEVYKKAGLEDRQIMVLAIHSEDANGVQLAVFWVKPETFDFIRPGEIYIEKSEFDLWKKVKII